MRPSLTILTVFHALAIAMPIKYGYKNAARGPASMQQRDEPPYSSWTLDNDIGLLRIRGTFALEGDSQGNTIATKIENEVKQEEAQIDQEVGSAEKRDTFQNKAIRSNYNPSTIDYDIAILKLASSIAIDGNDVGAIPPPPQSNSLDAAIMKDEEKKIEQIEADAEGINARNELHINGIRQNDVQNKIGNDLETVV